MLGRDNPGPKEESRIEGDHYYNWSGQDRDIPKNGQVFEPGRHSRLPCAGGHGPYRYGPGMGDVMPPTPAEIIGNYLRRKAYKCDDCHDTGWYGDNGPGIRGNREYAPCECREKGKIMDGLTRHNGNGQIETAAIQDRRERGWGRHEDDEEPGEEHYNLFADPDYSFQNREEILRMKGDLEDD